MMRFSTCWGYIESIETSSLHDDSPSLSLNPPFLHLLWLTVFCCRREDDDSLWYLFNFIIPILSALYLAVNPPTGQERPAVSPAFPPLLDGFCLLCGAGRLFHKRNLLLLSPAVCIIYNTVFCCRTSPHSSAAAAGTRVQSDIIIELVPSDKMLIDSASCCSCSTFHSPLLMMMMPVNSKSLSKRMSILIFGFFLKRKKNCFFYFSLGCMTAYCVVGCIKK